MKALSIFSGGLDSILAVMLIEEQGADVLGFFFETPFFSSQKAIQSARYIGLALKVVDITDRFLEIMLNPAWLWKGFEPVYRLPYTYAQNSW